MIKIVLNFMIVLTFVLVTLFIGSKIGYMEGMEFMCADNNETLTHNTVTGKYLCMNETELAITQKPEKLFDVSFTMEGLDE